MGLTAPPSEKRGLIKTTHLPGSTMPGTWPVPSEWHLPPEAACGSDAESRDREGWSWLPQWGTEHMLCALSLWGPRGRPKDGGAAHSHHSFLKDTEQRGLASPTCYQTIQHRFCVIMRAVGSGEGELTLNGVVMSAHVL